MSPQQETEALLAEMRDIQLPDPGGSGIVPGLIWGLAGFCLLLLMALAYLSRRRQHADWRVVAQNEFVQIRQQASEVPMQQTVSACSTLLRRVSLVLAPREQIAAMSGERWLAKLDQLHQSTQFSQGPGTLLRDLHYRKPVPAGQTPDNDVDQLLSLVDDFISNAGRS